MDPLTISAAVTAIGSAVTGGASAFKALKGEKSAKRDAPPDRIPIEDAGFMRNIATLTDTSSYIANYLSSSPPPFVPPTPAAANPFGSWAMIAMGGIVIVLFLVRR